jgi:hypothetical protein
MRFGIISRGLDSNGDHPTSRMASIRMTSIRDGTSNTIAVAEKFISTLDYESWAFSEDKGAFHGYDNGYVRSTVAINVMAGTTVTSSDPVLRNPMQDVPVHNTGTSGSVGWRSAFLFGSAHPAGINALMGDGSVRIISYTVNANTFNALGHISDGTVINASDF